MTQSEKLPATFVSMRTAFTEEFAKSLKNGRIDNIKAKWVTFDAKDGERRIALEEAIRTTMLNMMVTNGSEHPSIDLKVMPNLLDSVTALCRKELVSASLSVALLSDIFDTSTVGKSEKIFDFVEQNVATWKEPLFFGACKNNILRMCNDLLRRLSKTQHNIFSGRILLFLAMFFPFSERSGLNIVSEFNVDSFMKYGTEEVKEDSNELLESVNANVKLDSSFYTKFWSLQEYFRSPNLCYNKVQWKEFTSNSNSVLSVFKNFKLSTPDSHDLLGTPNGINEEEFITKFLTNQKLLLHQLEDTYFRRTIYIQFLILFQFLTAHIKTKLESNELKPDQVEWVKSSTDKVYTLIKESPPNGELFLANILHLLKRDEHWSRWKNDGCPALKKLMPHYDKPSFQNKPPTTNTCDWTNLGTILCRVKSIDKIIMPRVDGPEVVDMKHDYLAFCKGRRTVPELNTFLKDAIQQSESQEAVDPNNKKVADKQFSWVALKLLSQKSPHFFSLNHSPISKLPEFVDHICRKIFREQNPGLLLPPLMPAPKGGASGNTSKSEAGTKRSSSSVNSRASSGAVTNNIKDKSESKVKSNASVLAAPPPKMQKVANSNDKLTKSSSNESKTNNSTINSVKSSDKLVEKSSSMSTAQLSHKSSKEKMEKKEKTPPEKLKTSTQSSVQSSKSSKDKLQERSKSEKLLKSHDRDKDSSKSKKDKSPVKRKRSNDRESDEKRVALTSTRKTKDRKEDNNVDEPPTLKSEQISKLAKLISGSWKKVAEKLGYKSDEIDYFESQQDTDYNRAVNLLLIWTSNEEDATADSLRRYLKDLGMSDAANILTV